MRQSSSVGGTERFVKFRPITLDYITVRERALNNVWVLVFQAQASDECGHFHVLNESCAGHTPALRKE